MSFDPTLGQLLDGTTLPLLPPNASGSQQITIINQIIATLNSLQLAVVGSGVVEITLAAGASVVVQAVPHNLGYAPRAACFLNNATLVANAVTYTGVSYPLPGYAIGGAGPDGAGHILNVDFVDYWTDDKNLYIHWNSGVFYTRDEKINVTYFLTQVPAAT